MSSVGAAACFFGDVQAEQKHHRSQDYGSHQFPESLSMLSMAMISVDPMGPRIISLAISPAQRSTVIQPCRAIKHSVSVIEL